MANNNDMTDDDLRQIIGLQLMDVEIIPEPIHYNLALQYYRHYGSLPDINYLINVSLGGIAPIIPNLIIQAENNNNMPPHQNNYVSEEEDNDDHDHSYSDDNSEINELEANPNQMPPVIQENISLDQLIGHGLINSMSNRTNLFNLLMQSAGVIRIDNIMNENDLVQSRPQTPDFIIDVPNNNPANMVDVKKVIKDINTIPLIMFKNDTNPNKNTECLVCYDQFVDTDIIRIPPCTHSFHRCCIDDYFINETHLCPYCKNPAGEYVYHNL